MKITKEMLKDSVQFSNFAQRVKLAWWGRLVDDGYDIPEIYLDDILLLAWKDFEKYGESGN